MFFLIGNITVKQLREADQGIVLDEMNLHLQLQIIYNVCLIDRVSNSCAIIKVVQIG